MAISKRASLDAYPSAFDHLTFSLVANHMAHPRGSERLLHSRCSFFPQVSVLAFQDISNENVCLRRRRYLPHMSTQTSSNQEGSISAPCYRTK